MYRFVDIFTSCFCTTFRMPKPNVTSVTAKKPIVKYRFHAASRMLFHALKYVTLTGID